MMRLYWNQRNQSKEENSMAGKSVIIWLHGAGGFGADKSIKNFFSASQFGKTKWFFPTAPSSPVTCANGQVMPVWFDLYKMPITSGDSRDENGVLKSVQKIHTLINKEVASGVQPHNIFICGFSQGGALSLASALLYPETLGGAVVLSGFVPFTSSITERITPNAKKTPILWSHGTSDGIVLFEAGQAGPPFLAQAGMSCEFKAYRGLGHSFSHDELKSVASWVQARIMSSSSSSS